MCQGNINFESGNSTQSQDIIEYPLHQPLFTLSSSYVLVNPHLATKQKYLSAWPENLRYPEFQFDRRSQPPLSNSICFPKQIRLPLSSAAYGETHMYINQCQSINEFAKSVDLTLVTGFCDEEDDFKNFIVPYMHEFREKFLKRYPTEILPFDYNEIPDVDTLFYYHLQEIYENDRIIADPIPLSLQCHCELEATSLIAATKHAGLSLYNLFLAFFPSNKSYQDMMEYWTLESIDLVLNFSLSKLIMTFLKVIREFIPLTSLLKQVLELFNHTFHKIQSVFTFSQQPETEIALEATSLNISSKLQEELVNLNKYTDSTAGIATAIASVIVIFASAIIGADLFLSPNSKCVSVTIANALSCIARGKAGIYAMQAMISDFSKYLQQALFELTIGKCDDVLTKLIMESDIQETDNCKKQEFFDYLEFINNPANLLILQQNTSYQQRLEFNYKILEEINLKLATQPIEIPVATREYIKNQTTELGKLRKIVMKKPKIDVYRFKPFWINIIGKPQLGKSVFTTYLVETLYHLLNKRAKYDVPAKDNWYYPVNFTEKYLTHYTGQYIVGIDDFLQDSTPLGDRSSAIDVITWVSSVPHYTNQAALDDKGIPFTSKILVTTSNDSNMSPHGIASPEALKLRQAIRCEFIYNENYEKEPALGNKKVRIQLQNSEGRPIKEFKSVREFMVYLVKEFDKHWDKEQTIIKGNNATSEEIDSLYEECFGSELESTSLIPNTGIHRATFLSCLLGRVNTVKHVLAPGIEIELWNCKCIKHDRMNNEFLEFCKLRLDRTIHDFKEPYLMYKTRNYAANMKLSLSWIKDQILEYASKPIFKVIGTLTLSMGVLCVASLISKKQESEEELEPTKAQYNISKPRRSPPKPLLIATSRMQEIEPMLRHNVTNQNYQLIYNSLLEKGNICLLTSLNNNQINTAVRIGGRALLTNHHFFEYMNEGDKFEIDIKHLSGTQQKITQTFELNHCHRLGSSDLVVYKCDKSVPQARNIIKHFMDEKVLSQYLDAVVVGAYPVPVVMTNVMAKPNTHALSYAVGESSYSIIDTYETNCPVEQGMSGSVLIGTNDRKCNKIIGIQVCRNRKTGLGYFKPVTQQQLTEAFKILNVEEFEEEALIESTSLIVDERCPPNLGKNSIIYKGTMKKGTYLKPQTKSKIEPSLIHDYSKITQEPSVLTNKDERLNDDIKYKQDILFKAMEGFDHPIGCVNRKMLNKAVSDLKVEYDVELDVRGIQRRPLTEDETVNGIPKLINRVDMKTSPGWPFVTQRKLTTIGGKYEWFDELNDIPEGYGKFYKMKEDLKRGLEQREQKLLNGIKPQTIAYACLKDETRPLSKIKDGNTRAFLCLPLDYNLLIKKYFGSFIAAQHQRAGAITSCVGIDPATQWIDLYNKLMAKNNLWEDFDYKNWDQHLHPELIYSVATIVNYWYGDSDDSKIGKLRIMLLHDLIFTDIIVKDRLFRKSTGQCSGCAITAELNCIVHDVLMYYVWLLICKDKGIETDLYHYRSNVASIMYGDDIVKSVTNEYASIFNGETIKPYMIDLGMNITPGDKLSTQFVLKPPQEIYFLKRSFVKDGHYVKAPLRQDIIENIIQWIHKSDNNVNATLNNCETALKESYMHGGKYFKELHDNINERIKRFNLNNIIRLSPIVLNYESLDEQYKFGKFVCVGLNGPKHSNESDW